MRRGGQPFSRPSGAPVLHHERMQRSLVSPFLQAWFDGQPALDEQAFLFRLAGATYGIDTLYFSTFFGGGDQSWAPASAQIADFDDFIVSTGPITH
jgi:hypothetical protein